MWDDLPDVMFDPDLAKLFRTSERTIKRSRANGVWPIPTLPPIDRRNRTAKQAARRFVESGQELPSRRRRG